MAKRDYQKRQDYCIRPFYDGRVQGKTITFILAIMFGTGGGLCSGSRIYKATEGKLCDIATLLDGDDNFWIDCPDEWISAWRLMLFGGESEV
jgi:hypothetical protein